LADKVGQAAKDAIGSAALAAKLNFSSMLDEHEIKLMTAGREAAARIGNELRGNGRDLITAAADFRNHARTYTAVFGAIALIAGVVGGFVGAWLLAVT
jgi:hypothetical protein